MITKTFLILLVTLFGYSDYLLGTSMVQRPIVLGPLVGLIMGNLQAGTIMGATMELAMVGAISVGAYVPPDLVSGTVLGVSLAIESHASAAAALTLGIPIATIILALNTGIGQPIELWFIHRCDKMAAEGNTRGFAFYMYSSLYFRDLPGIIFTPAAFYFGQSAVKSLLSQIPAFIQSGMDVAVGLLPALGFAMLAQMIMNKKVAVFFFIGFFLVAYAKLSTTGVAIFAAMIVIVLYLYTEHKQSNSDAGSDKNGQGKTEGDGFDEF